MTSIVVLGLGIRGCEQVTNEGRRALVGADVVFHSVADDGTRRWLETTAKESFDLNDLYVDGRPRLEAYEAMAELVVSRAHAGADVVFAVYGHPCVLHTGVQLTLQRASQHGIASVVLPGISSIDQLFAVIGTDFGFGGLQVLEATDMLLYGRMPQAEGHVVILQVAVTGLRTHRADGHRGALADHLLRRLRTIYPANHPALHFRLGTGGDADSLIWTTVQRLGVEQWTNASSLYLPPGRPSRPDRVHAARLQCSG